MTSNNYTTLILTLLLFFIKTGDNIVKAGNLVLGSGCFWGRQHDFVQLEQKQWNRTASEISTIGVYFGGSSKNLEACYYNEKNISVYSSLGHAEAIQLQVSNLKQMKDAFKVYFQSFIQLSKNIWAREDYFDSGAGYRAMIGFQGGIKNDTVMTILNVNNPHHVTYKEAKGSDMDTLGLNVVWIYDTGAVYEERGKWKYVYPVHQTELCIQFHNNQTGTYSKEYHNLKNILVQEGKLKKTDCPIPEIDSCI
jgi:peptide methionine sulfoxide reductase MsrA